jgi:hypothetical protein
MPAPRAGAASPHDERHGKRLHLRLVEGLSGRDTAIYRFVLRSRFKAPLHEERHRMTWGPTRTTVALISLLTSLGACAGVTRPPQLAYEPPSVQPEEPGPAYAGQRADLIWNQLLDRLIQSDLQVDLADPERGIIVASYSGDPEPYVTCGWILVRRGGESEQVPASTQASFNRVVDGRQLRVNRGMKLDARLVVEVTPEGRAAAAKTISNYVLTKTVVAEDRSGRSRGRAQEVVSFSTGERGEFGKGTVCQPNGALERTVLDILPRAARVEAAEANGSAPNAQTAASNESPPVRRPTIMQSEVPSPVVSEVARSEERAAPSACPIADKIFCEVLEVTDRYRRANQEGDLGLAVDAIEGGNPLLDGSDLGFDISLPNYDAYLAVSYFLKDGTVHHVRSGSDRRWPANAREFVSDAGLSVADRESVELVVALASDVPVFASPRPPSETAELYLSDLRKRLSELRDGGASAQIAASLIVVTPA